jgi:predicted homoserine dehydrogenase-like protein
MAGGVFVTVRIDDQRIQADLEYLKVGKGKYYTFFRPYHLWFLEAPISVARAYLYKHNTLVPLEKPVVEVMTVAKRSLKSGEKLVILAVHVYACLPAKLLGIRCIACGIGPELIKKAVARVNYTWNDVELDETKMVVKNRRMQTNKTLDQQATSQLNHNNKGSAMYNNLKTFICNCHTKIIQTLYSFINNTC